MQMASTPRDHHFGTSMDPLRRRPIKVQSETTIAGRKRIETTAVWKNTGEIEEKQPTFTKLNNRPIVNQALSTQVNFLNYG